MAKGISLHIGVNKVDPDGYPLNPTYSSPAYAVVSKDYRPVRFDDGFNVGWEGPLASCEFDAEDMLRLARSQSFSASILKTKKATTGNVKNKIRSAAKKLKAGDIFLLTYAGHGAQVDDLNKDEIDKLDETWCLYDRMFLDDELQALYAEFARGVRVVVVADSCHSGSATRVGTSDDEKKREGLGIRAMPLRAAKAIYEGNKEKYDRIQAGLGKRRKPKASRILISACQDHQLAGGGDRNGQFTAALKEAWGGGKFSGNYRDLARKVKAALKCHYEAEVKRAAGEWTANEQDPNFVTVEGSSKKALAEFVKQRPFSI